ncbi:MAG TPA: nitroreductase family protein [Actinomycetota bacterium]
MTATDIDTAAVDHALMTTRAVRKRLDLDRPVEPEVILDCLRVATQAPTGSNLQTWRWIVVTDQAKRAALADLYARAIGPYLDVMENAFGNNPGSRPVIDSARHLVEILPRVPVLVVPCELGSFEDQRSFLRDAGYPIPISDNQAASGFYGSIWPAVWSFQVAARARGLGTALTTMHLGLEKDAGELLGIPETVSQIGLVPVAYYTGDTFKPASRRPAEEITYWNGWKEPWNPSA